MSNQVELTEYCPDCKNKVPVTLIQSVDDGDMLVCCFCCGDVRDPNYDDYYDEDDKPHTIAGRSMA